MAAEIEYVKGENRDNVNPIHPLKRHPWDYQPEIESSKQFIFFEIYKYLGVQRSLKKVVKESQKIKKEVTPYALNSIKKIAYDANWKQRAEAWDLYKLQEWTKNREERVHQMCTTHIKDAKMFHEKIVYEMEKHSEDLDVDKKAYYYDAMTRAYERMARLERISNGEIVEFDGLRLDTNYTAKDLDSLLKDPELTGDLTTLMSRVDEKIGTIKEEKAEADRAEKDRPKVEEFKDLYDEEKVVKKVSKNKQWWE